MAKLDSKTGDRIDLPLDAAVDSGDFVAEGDGIIGFAVTDGDINADGYVLAREGIHYGAPKETGTPWVLGDLLSHNGTAFVKSSTLDIVAVAAAAATSGAAVGDVVVLPSPLANPARIATLEGGGALPLGRFEADIAFGDFDAEATSQTLTFPALSATEDAYLIAVWLEKVTDFAGGSVSAATLEVGHTMGTPDPNAYVVAEDVFTGAGAGDVGHVTAELGVDQVPATKQPILTATNSITTTMRTTGDDVDALTSGAAKVHALYRLLG